MDWMDENIPDDLAIGVVNETGSQATANVGCRAGGDVLFADRVVLDPGERREWSESVAGAVEIGVQVRGGAEATERFDPGDGSGRVSATLSPGSVSFSTAGGRGRAGSATSGGADSFAAGGTTGGDSDGWGFDGGTADADNGWGFNDDGTDAENGWGFSDDDVDADAESHASTAAGSSTTVGAEAGSEDATHGSKADGDRGTSRRHGTTGGGEDATSGRGDRRDPEARERRSGGEPSDDESEAGSADDGGRTNGRTDGKEPDVTDEPEEPQRGGDEARPADAPSEAGNGGRAATGGGGGSSTAGAGEMYCTSCGAVVKKKAEICPECGVRQSSGSASPSPSASGSKDKGTAALLALLLGAIGAHHFYLGNTGRGIVYLLLSWTGIPVLIGLIEGVIYLTKSDEAFQRKYGG